MKQFKITLQLRGVEKSIELMGLSEDVRDGLLSAHEHGQIYRCKGASLIYQINMADVVMMNAEELYD